MRVQRETFETRLMVVVALTETLTVVGTLIIEMMKVGHGRGDLEFLVTEGVSGHLK